MKNHELDITVLRGDFPESEHRVHAAVVAEGDDLVGSAHDAHAFTYWRSCAKPFQVIPFLSSGGFDSLGWGDQQLAVSCASHGGEPEHVAIVERMLQDLGLEEGDLACGPHDPSSQRGAKFVREAGGRPTRIHNNCSGKHSAMLALARKKGWPTRGYERRDHNVQRTILHEISLWTDVPCGKIVQAVDGCGVVVFGMTLERMARAYSRFAVAAERGEEYPKRVIAAMSKHPFLVGGTDRFDTALIAETKGRVISKVGAEGVHCALIPARGIGIALKVEDGAQRAQVPALLRLLQEMEELPDPLPPRLHEWMHKPVKNTRGECVGEVTLKSDVA
ncbi:MAG TPA: asparaginase [Gemmatimonadaceae bacterium]|nr:asparaginase [Gemmatimonadaceae bacterium]